ncbi:MAG: hypothetical protein QXU18_03285 [Thermoplasmatales archaeon]
MNVYLEIFLVIPILLFVFLYWLPFLRKRRINFDQERKEEKEPGGEEEYYRIIKEGKKYREELKRQKLKDN